MERCIVSFNTDNFHLFQESLINVASLFSLSQSQKYHSGKRCVSLGPMYPLSFIVLLLGVRIDTVFTVQQKETTNVYLT